MRIHRLDFLRYGRFTDVALDLAVHSPDMHIVFGPNEAGKSTALSAIEDLLFGIPHNSSLNFVHQYGSMRIGAILQQNGETLRLRRRKGTKDTLLTPEETVLSTGDEALAPFLVGADRSFFTRMFSLDHERLRQGGREILEAQDEIGQMLFSIGAGIVGLRDRLKALDKDADALWAPRRASHRKYYQAEERLKAADSALRQHTITASKWQGLKRAYEIAREGYDALEQEIESKSAELRKLSRIRRLYRDVRRQSELKTSIAALGEVIPLAENACQALQAAGHDNANATTRIETLTEHSTRSEHNGMSCSMTKRFCCAQRTSNSSRNDASKCVPVKQTCPSVAPSLLVPRPTYDVWRVSLGGKRPISTSWSTVFLRGL